MAEGSEGARAFRGASLLIADDEPTVRHAYRALFEAEGYEVLLARNGEEAVRLFAERHPDVVLLDVMMPKMNGLVACREIRRQDELAPVLFFTALPSEVSLVRGFGCGADDYIDKARPPEEFLARVAGALRRRAAQARSCKGQSLVRLGTITVDLAAMAVYDGMRAIAELTRSEALVLRALAARRGDFVSNEEIFQLLHGSGFTGDVLQVRKHVLRLRGKLGRAADLIRNSPGVGYRLL